MDAYGTERSEELSNLRALLREDAMKIFFGFFTALLLVGQAWSADVYVRDAEGQNLSESEIQRVTDSVKQAVTSLPEHSLSGSEDQADFVLAPSIVNRGDQMVLRVEKQQDGNIVSVSEEIISSVDESADQAGQLAQTTAEEDSFMSGDMSDMESDRGPASAADEPAADTDMMSEPSAQQATGGETRARSPRIARGDNVGYFTIGAGPGFAVGLDTDNLMYNVLGQYSVEFNPTLTGKVFGDFYFGSGTDNSNFINLGVGADYYPGVRQVAGARPYITGDVGFGTTRNEAENTENALSLGAGGGFRFIAERMTIDTSLHYTILTAELDDDTPQVLALRVALNF